VRVLVAYDDTEGARKALAATASLLRSVGPELVVLHVLNPLIDAARVNAPTTRDAMVEVIAAARAAIEAQLERLGLQADVRAEPVARGEDDWEHIVRTAQEIEADVIAIGSHRAGGLAGAVLGSVVRSVVQHSPCPVLLVRPDHH
jgi:nucleotide-binding universal stress UspA family protein